MGHRLGAWGVAACIAWAAGCHEGSGTSADAGTDPAVSGPAAGVCGACARDADCEAPLECKELASHGRHCVDRTPEGVCARGYAGRVLESGGPSYCVPEIGDGDCRACLVSGCPDGACCGADGTCRACRARCQACETDLDCSLDLRCSVLGGGVCVVDCTAGGTCDDGATCVEAARIVPYPVRICRPADGTCG